MGSDASLGIRPASGPMQGDGAATEERYRARDVLARSVRRETSAVCRECDEAQSADAALLGDLIAAGSTSGAVSLGLIGEQLADSDNEIGETVLDILDEVDTQSSEAVRRIDEFIRTNFEPEEIASRLHPRS